MMRILLLYFCLGFSTVLSSQSINQTDENGKKQGIWEKRYDNGKLRYTGNFVDDKPQGLMKHYYESGELKVEIDHHGAIAYATIFYPDGKIKAKGKYENEQKDSLWVFYGDDGSKRAEEFYLSGKREGVWKQFYPSGKIAEEKSYTNDVEDGSWKQYFENGQERMMSTYVDGSLEGETKYHDAGGKLLIKGNFYHDVRHGTWTFYNESGEIDKQEEYIKGNLKQENDDDLIDDKELKTKYEKKDFLEFEDMLPPVR